MAVTGYRLVESKLRYTVPVLYASLVGSCIYLFHSYCYPHVTGDYHRHVFIPITYVLPFVSLGLAVWSDPGKINKSNHQRVMEQFEYDNIIFHSGNECRTCKFEKPARSKHCSTCNSCIAVCDHHCIWINNCVGYNNYRWFMLFLIANTILVCYGFVLTRSLLAAVVRQVESDQPASWASFLHIRPWITALYSNWENKTTGCLMIFSGSLSTVCIAFLLVHLRYLYQGMTTNETPKWEEIGECIEDGTLFCYKYPETSGIVHVSNEPSIVLQRLSNGMYHRALTPKEKFWIEQHGMVLRQVKGFEDINNIYDRGFVNNLLFLLRPKRL